MKSIRNGFVALLAVAVLLFGSWPASSATAMHDDNKAEVVGPIISLPNTDGFIGQWTVGRTKVNVTKDTKIDQLRGKVAVGAVVEVEGTKQNDGSINAREIEVKLSPGSGVQIKFSGKIEELPSTPNRIGDWKVSGKVVHVTAATEIEQGRGQVAVGALVEVEGLLQTDGSVNALEIEVKPDPSSGIQVKFLGRVEKLPPDTNTRVGDWVVSGRAVRVTANTRIIQERFTLMIGSLVEVEGLAQNDGVILASKIEVKGNVDNPTLFVNFRGVIESLPNTTTFIGDWKVSGRTVKVTDKTQIKQERGKVAVGATVEVNGTLNTDGSVNAQKIEVKDNNPPGFIRFVARVVTLPTTADLTGDWKVGDKVVHVSATTKINQEKGKAAVGALVEVKGTLRSDGSVDATEIEVKHVNNDTANYIRFFGVINTLPGDKLIGDWMVGTTTVHVVERTRIRQEHGAPVVKAFVEVEGNLRADNSVDAFVIEVERDAAAPAGTIGFINFYGQIKGLPTATNFVGDWTVGAKTVHVNANTKIDTRRGQVAVNAFVEVYGYLLADGSVTALKIEVRPVPPNTTANINRSYVEFIGDIRKLPNDTKNYVGDWTVGGRVVHVKERTVIHRERAAVVVSATAEIYGAELADGSIDAKFIEVAHGPAGAGFVAFAPVSSVNAGSYLTATSSSAIIAAFGSNLASRAETAKNLPLPTTLGGVSVLVDGRAAGLFFVSPNQINYQAPDGMLPGSAQVSVMRDGNVVAQGSLDLDNVAPSLFTADASGQGLPAGLLLRVKANGQQVYEPLTRSAITRQPGDRLFLVLFGTGMSGAEDSDGNATNGSAENVQATIGNANAPVIFAGRAPGFAGLDQCNIEIPASARGSNLSVLIKVNDGEGKLMRANSVTISVQ